MIKKKKNFFLLVFLLICFFLIYRTSFTSFFSQDDFYHLALGRIESPLDFFNFFNPWVQKDVHFRPLGTQVFFAIAHLFSQNLAPLILRLIALIFHLANFYLVFLLLKKFLKKETPAVILAGLYLLAPLHFMSLYYISAFQQILATFCQLLAFWFFSLGKKKRVFFCFALALLSKETAIVFPGLLLIFSYIIRPEKKAKDYFDRIKKNWRFWATLLLLLIFYGFGRFLTFVNYPGDNYQLLLSPRTLISSWRWYLIWLIGAPETIIRYAGRLFAFNFSAFVKDGGFWARIFLGTFLAEVVILCLIIISALKKKVNYLFLKKNFWKPIWWLAFFILSLLPVSFFPYHRYAHYLDLAFFSLLLSGGLLFVKIKISKKLWVFLFIAFLFNSLACVVIDQRLHWAPARTSIAQGYWNTFNKKSLCQEEGVYFIDNPSLSAKEANIALFGFWGPAYFCQYQPLSIYYQGVNEPGEKDFFKVITLPQSQ